MNFKNNSVSKRLLSLLLVGAMAISMAACGGGKKPESSSGSIIENSSSISESSSESSGSSESGATSSEGSSSTSSGSSSSASSVADTRTPAQIQKDMLTKMVNHYNKVNEDTVGYLYVPNTTINDVVVQGADNDFYLRRNSAGKNSFDGSYYVDYRGVVGSREKLSPNTVIYGHSMEDDPNGKYFSQLKKLEDLNYAKNNQFIYFSTPQSEMVWQIFAVFYTDTSFDYINPTPTNSQYLTLINEARARSVHNYGIDVTTKDKILTLSTCTYKFSETYPNPYRYVVMAKLVDKNAPMTNTTVEKNPSAKMPTKK